MERYNKRILGILRGTLPTVMVWALMGCASGGGADSSYHESAFNDLNKAPARFSLPSSLENFETQNQHPANLQAKADYFFTMGETYSLDGESRKSIESYKTVLLYDPESPTVYLRLAVESVKLGMISEGIEYCESALKIDPKRIDTHLLLAGLHTSIKAYDRAIQGYEEVLKLDKSNTEAPLYLGAVYAEKKQYKKALSYFSRLADDDDYKNGYLVEYYMGRVYQEINQNREAEAAFRRSLNKKSDFYDGLMALGALYELQGQKEKEIDLYVKFQRENGPQINLAEALSQIFLSRKEYERALEQLSLIEELGDEALSAKVKIALIYVEQKKYDQAIKKFEETLEMAPESDKVRFYLAALFEEMKEFDKAIKYFQEVPSDSNYFSESVVHAAYLLRQKNELQAARNTLERGLDLKPESAQMYSLYATVMDGLGEGAGALPRLEQGVDRFPTNVQLLYYFGILNDKAQKKEVMLKAMRKVLELDPKHAQAINYMAYTFADSGENLSEAEALARKALALSPDYPFIMDTLGWVLFKQGKISESIPWLEAAYSSYPKESVFADHLGDAYRQYNLPIKAQEMYRRALLSESDGDRQKNIEIKLTTLEKAEGLQRLPASLLEGPTPIDIEK